MSKLNGQQIGELIDYAANLTPSHKDIGVCVEVLHLFGNQQCITLSISETGRFTDDMRPANRASKFNWELAHCETLDDYITELQALYDVVIGKMEGES